MKRMIGCCALLALTACDSHATSEEAKKSSFRSITSVSFSATPAPTEQWAQHNPYAAWNMSVPYTTSIATFTFQDGSQARYPLRYQTFFKTDDVIPFGTHAGEYYGGVVDRYGAAILDPVADHNPFYTELTKTAEAAGLKEKNRTQFIADAPDGAALIQLTPPAADAKHAQLSYLNHFEYVTWNGDGNVERAAGKKKPGTQYRKNPMFVGNSVVNQDLTTGQLSIASFDKVTFADAQGLWTPCAASQSPWNTFLGSEEYQADAFNFEQHQKNPDHIELDKANRLLHEAFAEKFHASDPTPYHYGYVTEITPQQQGEAKAVKHYATGRWARELIQMMPDARTYYSGDDGKSTVLFMGIADHANDLSAVTLYAAKFNQTSPKSLVAHVSPQDPYAVAGAALGAGDVSWIRLGHATDSEVKSMIDRDIQASDIFDITLEVNAGMLPERVNGVKGTGSHETVTPMDMHNAGFQRTFNYYHPHSQGIAEWVRLRQGMETAAAFLETRRYAGYLGATSEWTKMEGVSVNAADKQAYLSVSYQYDSMSDGEGDIQMGLLKTGNVYQLNLAGNIKDRAGHAIASDWVATSLAAIPELRGIDNAYAQPPAKHKRMADTQGNLCAVNRVANPDNLKFSAAFHTLFVGEDSDCHVNNFVWAFDVTTRQLTRILSAPMGAESTGLMSVDHLNGFSYIGSSYQHPGDEKVGKPPVAMIEAVEKANPNFAKERNRSGGAGYLSFEGMPRMP